MRQLRDRPDIYWEDFLYMPPQCLCFYMWALIEHVKIAICEEEEIDLSRFITVVEARGSDLAEDAMLRDRCREMLSAIDRFYRESFGQCQPRALNARSSLDR